MSGQRLLILSFPDISADARVLKQVRYFAERYEVTTYGYGPCPDARVVHIELDPSSGIRRWRRRDLVLRRFHAMYDSQPAVRRARADLSPLEPFDVILANDIDTVPIALELAPLGGVHADIHEYAPRQNEEILIWRIFEAPYMRWLCRRLLPRVASMTTVGAGIAAEYRRVFGVDAEVVTNAAPYAELPVRPVDSPIRLVHSGASLRNRRLELLLDAVTATTSDVTLDLYLMGNDPEYVGELRKRGAASDRIRFPDPVPYSALIERLNEYDMGVHVVAPTNFNNRWALPNKFYDYVQARLGLIIGPSPEMRSILKEYDLGVVTESFDASSLTTVLDSLTTEQTARWKTNANAAARTLSAEAQVEIWGKAVDRLMSLHP
jgi:hypothetical protein